MGPEWVKKATLRILAKCDAFTYTEALYRISVDWADISPYYHPGNSYNISTGPAKKWTLKFLNDLVGEGILTKTLIKGVAIYAWKDDQESQSFMDDLWLCS